MGIALKFFISRKRKAVKVYSLLTKARKIDIAVFPINQTWNLTQSLDVTTGLD
jgi:hypothetical protein